jgi:hypothetical protein
MPLSCPPCPSLELFCIGRCQRRRRKLDRGRSKWSNLPFSADPPKSSKFFSLPFVRIVVPSNSVRQSIHRPYSVWHRHRERILRTPQMHKHPHPVRILRLGRKRDGTASQTHRIVSLFRAVQTAPGAPCLVVRDQSSPEQEFIYHLSGGQDSLHIGAQYLPPSLFFCITLHGLITSRI